MSIKDRARKSIGEKSPAKKRRRKPRRRNEFKWYGPPDGFELVIDSRETLPFFIGDPHYKSYEWAIDTVKYGDYTFEGGEDIIAIERKMKGDFYQYIIEHDKTVEKLQAMQHLKFRGLVIECTEYQLYNVVKSYSKSMSKEKIRGFLRTLNIKYGMHVYINGSLEKCQRWTMDRLVGAYEYHVVEEGMRRER